MESKKRMIAFAMAKKRGKVAVEWLSTNKLTIDTKPEFDRLMKATNKEFKTKTLEE